MDKNKVIESAAKLIAKGALDKAVKEYQRVLELDPDDVRVLQKLAELYQRMNRKAEAADCFEKVARTYSQQGFYLKAVALYKQVLKVIDRVEVSIAHQPELLVQLGEADADLDAIDDLEHLLVERDRLQVEALLRVRPRDLLEAVRRLRLPVHLLVQLGELLQDAHVVGIQLQH